MDGPLAREHSLQERQGVCETSCLEKAVAEPEPTEECVGVLGPQGALTCPKGAEV